MASMLKTAKHFLKFTGITRLNTLKYSRSIVEGFALANESNFVTTFNLSRCMSTPVSQPEVNLQETVLERSLRKIDQDVRRSGRIARRDIEDVLEDLLETKSVTSTQALLIIRCCGNFLPEESPASRTKLVQDLWKTLDNLDIQLDISHYNALLRVFLENEHNFIPNEFLSMLNKKGIEPNRVTYCRLMARYCQQGDMDGATDILQVMRDQQMPVNEGVFNTLLMGHSQAGDMQSAVSTLDLMKQASLDPSEETYTALMCGYAKTGDIEAIKNLVQECKAKEVFLQDKDYMEIIFTLAANGWVQHIDEVIELLEKSWGYNQDALNLILRLVNINQIDVAFKILKTMPRAVLPDGKPAPTGIFFVRQMVKSKQPVEKIIEVCQELISTGLNERALHVAVEHSLHLGSEYGEMAERLMKVLQGIEPSMKQHQFWPLLVSRGKAGDIPGLLKVIEHMKKDFNVAPSSITLRDHVIPYLPKESSSDTIIGTLKSAQISTASAASALVAYHLGKLNIGEAADVAKHHYAHYSPTLLRRPLSIAYCHTKDVTSYLTILHKVMASVNQANSVQQDVGPDTVVGSFIVDVASVQDVNTRASTILPLLKGLVDERLGMNNEFGNQLKLKLRSGLTEEISALIDKLTSTDMRPPMRRAFSNSMREVDGKDITTLEKLKQTLEEQSQSTLAVRQQLLSLYCRNRDLEKADAIKASLDEEQITLSSGTLAQMLDLYTYHDLCDKSWNIYQKLLSQEPDFPLGHTKVMKLALLLAKLDRLTDCIAVLNQQGKNRELLKEPSFSYSNLCWKLLHTLAESGNVSELQQVFNVLIENKFAAVSNSLLGPLVKVHIIRGDLTAALAEFERCCDQYRATPSKNELACKLIMSEDSNALQKLTDLSTGIHGEINSLYDLVFSFIECGKIRHAKRILETPGLGARPQRLLSTCERYTQDCNTGALEGLITATKDSSHIMNRSLIYSSLLHCYAKSNDVDKALELWTSMQEEDVVASDQFLNQLAMLLQKNGRNVPFSVPTLETLLPVGNETKINKTTIVNHVNPASKSAIAQFRKALTAIGIGSETGGVDSPAYIAELKKMGASIISDYKEKKTLPKSFDLKFALRHLANAGDLSNIEEIGKLLTDVLRKQVNFEKFVCIASTCSGKGEEYLAKLECLISEAKNEDVEVLRESYPRGGSTTLLIHNPALKQRFEDMARSYAVRDIYFPINDLWAYYFEKGEESQAGELWSEFLAKTPKIVLEHVLETARTSQDAALGQRLVSQLKCSDKLPWIIGSAHACLIDIYVAKNDSDNALQVLDDAIKGGYVEGVKSITARRLEKLLQIEGKPIPQHLLRLKVNSTSNKQSISSSDEEK